jgi:hypothetical protein
MVLPFEIAAVNKGSVESESLKRFGERGYSKKTIRHYRPDIAKAKFIRRESGFSIYRVPLEKVKSHSRRG